jgi:hypothetical protein
VGRLRGKPHFSSTAFVDAAKQNVVWLSLNLPEAYFTCESVLWLSDAFADGGGTKGASLQGALWVCSAAVLCGGMRLLPEHTSPRPLLGPR